MGLSMSARSVWRTKRVGGVFVVASCGKVNNSFADTTVQERLTRLVTTFAKSHDSAIYFAGTTQSFTALQGSELSGRMEMEKTKRMR